MKSHLNIVFFDGVCTLCNSTVSTLVKMDTKKKLKYSPIQGEKAKLVLSKNQIEKLDTIFFWSDGILYEKSEAITKILLIIGGKYKFVSHLIAIFPFFITNIVYSFISRNRYFFFGKKNQCRIPSQQERDLFIN